MSVRNNWGTLPTISAAAHLNPNNRQILLSYLHLLHMQEFIHAPGSYYRNYQYHWLLPPPPNRALLFGGGREGVAHWV